MAKTSLPAPAEHEPHIVEMAGGSVCVAFVDPSEGTWRKQADVMRQAAVGVQRATSHLLRDKQTSSEEIAGLVHANELLLSFAHELDAAQRVLGN